MYVNKLYYWLFSVLYDHIHVSTTYPAQHACNLLRNSWLVITLPVLYKPYRWSYTLIVIKENVYNKVL